ncbi:MAG: hypothetical protein HQL07_07525 [Nitrospirae bacterium]|nr:hypothetical protein [Magnetococcales bacterium]
MTAGHVHDHCAGEPHPGHSTASIVDLTAVGSLLLCLTDKTQTLLRLMKHDL